MVGIMLDGRPIYGRKGAGGDDETGLDACGGHVGPAPAPPGATGETGSFYHYHVKEFAPFSVGCYSGGVERSAAECRAVESACGDGTESVAVRYDGQTFDIDYDLWCPCFDETDDGPANPFDATASKIFAARSQGDDSPSGAPPAALAAVGVVASALVLAAAAAL